MYSPRESINLPWADCIRLYILWICLILVIRAELLKPIIKKKNKKQKTHETSVIASHFSFNQDW